MPPHTVRSNNVDIRPYPTGAVFSSVQDELQLTISLRKNTVSNHRKPLIARSPSIYLAYPDPLGAADGEKLLAQFNRQ